MTPTKLAHSAEPPLRHPRYEQTLAGHLLLGRLDGSGNAWELEEKNGTRRMLTIAEEVRLHGGRAERRAFERRLKLRASLDHRHLASIVEGGESERGHYTVMEVPAGRPLSALIREGALDPRRAVRLLGGVAYALDAAHQHGLLHLELEPSNVLVTTSAEPYALLTDFGILPAVSALRVAVSPDYRSPEELRGDAIEPRSNVYSLACVLYACLTGHPPFVRESPIAVLYAHCSNPAPRLTDERPDLPRAIDAVLTRALAKEPEGRPASAALLMRAAAEALGISAPPNGRRRAANGASAQTFSPRHEARATSPALAPAPSPAPPTRLAPAPAPSRRPPRSARRVPVALGVALAIGGTGGLLAAGDGSSSPDPVVAAQERAAVTRASTAATQTRERNAWRADADAAIARLDDRRAAGRRRLAEARTQPGQARLAQALARSFGAAARDIPRAPASVPAAKALEAALRSAVRAYSRLAGSYRGRRGAGNTRAAVRRAEAGVASAIARLDASR